jgi:hypothetical protein
MRRSWWASLRTETGRGSTSRALDLASTIVAVVEEENSVANWWSMKPEKKCLSQGERR